MDDSEEISKLLHKRLLSKLDEIVAVLDGIVTPLQRALLAQILDHIDGLDKRIQELDRMAETYMAQFQPAIAEVCQMPGIARRSAEVILAETGIDMSRFPSAAHLCSRGLSGQPPECREAASRQNTQGESGAEVHAGAVRQGGRQRKGFLFCGPVSAHRSQARKEPGDHGPTPCSSPSTMFWRRAFHSVIWERIIMTVSAENIKFGTT